MRAAKKPKKKTVAEKTAEDLAAANALFCLRSRKLTREHLETMTWSLWASIRLNANSLDSQRHCNEILMAMEQAISYIQGRLEEQQREHEVTKRVLKETKAALLAERASENQPATAKEPKHSDGKPAIPSGGSS